MSTRTRSTLKGIDERMVEAVIETEEECKKVPRCTWRATDPTNHSYIAPQLNAGMHRKPAMLKPFLPVHGPSTSYSVRDGLLPVHPLVLGLPATLRASTLMTKMRCNELVKRPSNDVSLVLTALAALVLASGPSVPSSDRTLALATALPPWLVGRNEPTREESPEESFCPTDHRLTLLGHPGAPVTG